VNPECWFEDHLWHGGSACVRCGARLRCICGRFTREDGMAAHVDRCVVIEQEVRLTASHDEMRELDSRVSR